MYLNCWFNSNITIETDVCKYLPGYSDGGVPGRLTSSSRSKPAAMCGGCTARQPMPALPCHGRARRLIVDASPADNRYGLFMYLGTT